MNPAAIIAILMQIVSMLPDLIAAGVKVEGLIARATAAVASGSNDPSDAAWQAVRNELDALTARLNVDPPEPT